VDYCILKQITWKILSGKGLHWQERSRFDMRSFRLCKGFKKFCPLYNFFLFSIPPQKNPLTWGEESHDTGGSHSLTIKVREESGKRLKIYNSRVWCAATTACWLKKEALWKVLSILPSASSGWSRKDIVIRTKSVCCCVKG
jgi:hypothetical protein